MRRVAETICVVLIGVLPGAAAGISAPRLVADLGTAQSPRDGSAPAEFVRVGEQVLFTARPDDHARRLFRSDGTVAGTQQLASGCGTLDTGGFSLRFTTATRAFYAVQCAGGGESLWISDGTPAGTGVLLPAGSYSSPGSWAGAPQAVEDGAFVYFLQAGQYDRPLELWRTDGTVGGTALVAVVSDRDDGNGALHLRGVGDLLLVAESSAGLVVWTSDGTSSATKPVSVLSYPGQYTYLRSLHSTATGIAFLISAWPDRAAIWYSDGTAEGTVLGAELADYSTQPAVEHAGSIYFLSEIDGSDWVWRGDGSAASTRPILSLGTRAARSDSFEFVDDHLYFIACAEDGISCALVRTSLSGGIEEEVAQVCSGTYCDPSNDALWVRGADGRLVFTRRTMTDVSVWTSAADGSNAAMAAPLCATEPCFWPSFGPVVLDTTVFFAARASDGETSELWSSDGTPAGTYRLAGPLSVIDWHTPSASNAPLAALPDGAGWLFAGGETQHGLELWRARPQADAGALVADMRLDRPGLFDPEPVGTVDSIFVFALMGDDGSTRTLYRHTLGESGVEPFLTVPVRRGRYGSRNAPPALRPAGNAWFFIESDFGDENPFARQIWRYDPVSRDLRTLFAEDPQETGLGARADDLVPSGADFLFLGSTDPELHPAIYRLRPRSGAITKLFDLPAQWATAVGTSANFWYLLEDGQRVVAIDLSSRARSVLGDFPGAYLDQAVALDEGLLFSVDWSLLGSGLGVELRQAHGAEAGTPLLGQWSPSTGGCGWHVALPAKGSASPALFAVQTYCTAAASELWTSDGSLERTRSLRSFPLDHLDFAPAANRSRGELLFLASHFDEGAAVSRYAIWRSDGTPAGTQEVTELPAGSYSGTYDFAAATSGAEAVYFAWSDPEHGRELWRSDGTAAGTGLAADLEPGPVGSSLAQLRTVGDQVLFTAGTADSGLELWQVDGGVFPPQPVADLYPGIESSAPSVLAATEGGLFFLADDGVVGREIWEVERPSVAPCVADATTLCLANGRFRARAVRRDFEGELGSAGVVPLTGDSGYFWFFAPGNPEVLLKVVDACGLPGFENFWAYSTGLTNVEVELEVVDTLSGERKIVRTALGEAYGPLFDSGSFQVCAAGGGSAASGPASAPVAGAGSSTVLPLLGGRFEARASWRKRDGTTGVAAAVPLAGDSGFFWFFDPAIVEVLVKMVDACGFDGFDNFWVFAGGLTDVEVHLEVTDTWSGEVVRHDNLQGRPFASLLETGKLRACEAAPPLP